VAEPHSSTPRRGKIGRVAPATQFSLQVGRCLAFIQKMTLVEPRHCNGGRNSFNTSPALGIAEWIIDKSLSNMTTSRSGIDDKKDAPCFMDPGGIAGLREVPAGGQVDLPCRFDNRR